LKLKYTVRYAENEWLASVGRGGGAGLLPIKFYIPKTLFLSKNKLSPKNTIFDAKNHQLWENLGAKIEM